jgi:phage/plasmid-associated DNA primase
MRQDYFDFVPTFKLFIVGNHKPRLNVVDEAIRRRMLIVPVHGADTAARARPQAQG